MTIANITTIISIIISILALFITLFYNNKIKSLTIKYNQLVSGQSELFIQNSISTTKKAVLDHIFFTNENPAEDDEKKEARTQLLWALQEDNLNAYETACSLYLDNKTDKERFKKQYSIEIKNLVEDEQISEKFFNGLKIKFGAIDKVYRDWFHLEK